MNKPLYLIGSAQVFTTGIDSSYSKETPPAYITISGAIYLDGEWYYYEEGNRNILYAESKVLA